MYKVYIAGKITGDNDYKKKFDRAAVEIEKDGFIVLNPAVLPEGLSEADYARICHAFFNSADMVYFLRDYHESEGGMLEYQLAKYVNKQTMFEGYWDHKHAG